MRKIEHAGKQLAIYGDKIVRDEKAEQQIKTCLEHEQAIAGALMADHHLGYSMPIGGVIAYDGGVSPSGVGFDIACGNKAVQLDIDHEYVRANIATIMDQIYSDLTFGVGGSNRIETVEHDLYEDPGWDIPICKENYQRARVQLGTIGSGNHYVDVFVDEADNIWIGVHFGSRGFGHGVASYFVREGGGKDGMFVDAVVLDESSDLGEQYIMAMKLAGRYAYARRS
jgi:tRNA-splicing ligase RtcB